ncbi:YbaM family protein [Rheinheimera sp.]|uniref:YbaM family protein n=1 Tax=Rheinheimera sp. TaxID=1869214 RepID=UPI003AF8AA91
MTKNSTTPLSEAAPEVQLAVDLIQLLEQHQLPAELVLGALKIVQRDYQNKLQLAVSTST